MKTVNGLQYRNSKERALGFLFLEERGWSHRRLYANRFDGLQKAWRVSVQPYFRRGGRTAVCAQEDLLVESGNFNHKRHPQ